MPKKELITEACVRQMAPGTELRLGSDRIATPAALDLASERGVRVSYFEGRSLTARDLTQEQARGPWARLWAQMKAQDGTYVVQVQAGRARVTRLSDSGPMDMGGE